MRLQSTESENVEGELATRLGLAGIPVAAETALIMLMRLVELTGGRYHIAQISAADSVGPTTRTKRAGVKVSCGVSALILMLNENDVENYRSFAGDAACAARKTGWP